MNWNAGRTALGQEGPYIPTEMRNEALCSVLMLPLPTFNGSVQNQHVAAVLQMLARTLQCLCFLHSYSQNGNLVAQDNKKQNKHKVALFPAWVLERLQNQIKGEKRNGEVVK